MNVLKLNKETLKTKLKSLCNFDFLFKAVGFILFVIYLLQLYVGYDIDSKRVFEGPLSFVTTLTYLMIFLRWSTIVAVGYAVIVPFFGGKTMKTILMVMGPVVAIFNLILLKYNFIAWGPKTDKPWREALFIIEQILIILISIYSTFTLFKNKELKEVKWIRVPIVFITMYLTFAYQPLLNILFGTYGVKTLDFSGPHLILLSMNLVLIIGSFFLMGHKTKEEKNIYFAALSCSGVFNFFYTEYGGLGSLPFHLCNTAIIMMFCAYIFKMKGVFYFTYFVNVLGALFAMLTPNVTTDVFAHASMRFWYNHIYAFSLPLLGIALKVYDRPTLKMMSKAIFWFTIYYIIVIFLNVIFTGKYHADVNYFFINDKFFFEKLKIKNQGLMDNYILTINKNGNTYNFYWLFYIAVYSIYIGLMFVVWYVYDCLYHISDSHYALRMKKKLIREGYQDLKKLLNGRSINDPLYEEMKDMIEIKNFTKIYSGATVKAVDDLTLTINNGEVYGFLGHNGAGKSTTIKSIVGIQTITSGHIIVDGYDVQAQPVEAKLRIGYVSDNHAVYERLTGREYINYIADLYMVSQEDRDERIEKYTKMFKLEDAIDKEIKGYSHGMKQKIVVIASLIHDPKVWILDEPLTGLDPTSAYQIKECMKEHASRGNIVFFSSHVIEVVEKVCDKICIINHGKLQCEYALKDLKAQGISLEEIYLKYVQNQEELHIESKNETVEEEK